MTYKELFEQLGTLTEEQLNMQAIVRDDGEHVVDINELWIADEDHVNPSGEGAEPRSLYNAEEIADELVVFEAGKVFLEGLMR